jgi:hypothetical protein
LIEKRCTKAAKRFIRYVFVYIMTLNGEMAVPTEDILYVGIDPSYVCWATATLHIVIGLPIPIRPERHSAHRTGNVWQLSFSQ